MSALFKVNDQIDFSVLMAVYSQDDPSLFERAIASVYENSIQPNKFVLVVDGPITEALEIVLNKFKKYSSFQILRLNKNQGLAHALNFGIAHIDSEFILRADADDFNMLNRFEIQSQYMIDGYDLFGSDILEVDENGHELSIRKTPEKYNQIMECIKRRNPFNHMTVGFRTSMVKNLGGYPELDLREDYALWILMLSNGANAKNSNKILVKATAGSGMYKRRGGIRAIKAEYNLQKFLYLHNFTNIISSTFYIFLKSIIFLMPYHLRGLFYRFFLRN
jgi:glycosyltransferase involved in cell wall biosynthesis